MWLALGGKSLCLLWRNLSVPKHQTLPFVSPPRTLLSRSLEGLTRAAGDTITYVSDFLSGTTIPVIAKLASNSFAKSKSREDPLFLEYLELNGREDVLVSAQFGLAQIGRADSLLAEITKYDRQYVIPSGPIRASAESSLLHVCRVWTWVFLDSGREALRLLSPVEALESMDGSKSAGFPWRLFEASKDALMCSRHSHFVMSRVEHLWSVLDAPLSRIEALWYSFLKEELRPLEKLNRRVPAVRSISGAPVDLSIVGNQLCHDFNEAFYAFYCKPEFGSVVGISPFHGGWDRLARLHWHDGGHVRNNSASIDVTQWDRSFSPYLFDLVVRLRVMIANETASQELRGFSSQLHNLYTEVVNSAVVIPGRSGSEVALLSGGMKSGWVNTTTDNTLGHMIVLFAFAFHHGIAAEIGRGFVFSLYGDDNLVSWSDALDGIFQPSILESWYRSWGFETHGVNVTRGEARYSQVFLGGSFAVCPVTLTYVYCPESGQKAFDSVRYKYRDDNTAFQRVCALRVLHYYNTETYGLLDGYAKYLLLNGEVSKDLLPNYLGGQVIRALHTGRESGDDRLFPTSLLQSLQIFFPAQHTQEVQGVFLPKDWESGDPAEAASRY